MNLDKLIESLLLESAALTKGSQRVLGDKKLVTGLANAVKDDVAINPASFPAGSKNNFKNATDEAIAQWFLENIDTIEREGYEGTVYSRDGVNSDWIVRRYIAGSHNWEDLTGVMNMNLYDWYILKNRNLLDANHKDLAKFNSVRQVGSYMTTHYKQELEKLRDAARNAARAKLSKSVKLVDNDDYRVYTTLNRAAGCALGLGTQWCTANSHNPNHYHRYSDAAMLFQLFPYDKEPGEDGKKQLNDKVKYQFDAGSGSFMDITDNVANKNTIRKSYPYLYTDLTSALRSNKGKLEKAFKDLSADPTLQGADHKIKTYEIDEEIQKLHKFVDTGFFTDEVRPATEPEPEEVSNTPELQGIKKEQPMESLRDLAKAMLEDKKLGHIVQQYKPIDKSGQDSPLTNGGELEETEFGQDDMSQECEPCTDVGGGLEQAVAALKQTLASRQGPVEEDDMMQDPAAMAGQIQGQGQAQTGGTLGGASGGAGGGHYAPGTAPTMPESVEQQKEIMKEMDEDVAAMLNTLNTYDALKESGKDVPAFIKNKEDKADAAEKDTVKESKHDGVDPEVLEWMARFEKLGKMTGY